MMVADGTTSGDGLDIQELDRGHFIHPFLDGREHSERGCLVIERGEGAYVFDTEGNRILDGIGGLWCVNAGHGRREIVEAMAEQASTLEYYNPFGATTTIPAARLAHRLGETTPGDLSHVFFTTGGSTANDIAIQLVQLYFNCLGQPKKKHIISRVNGYHGSTYLTSCLSGIHSSNALFDCELGFVSHVSAPNLYRRPEGMSEQAYCDFLVDEFAHRVQQLGPDRVAAFVAEPIMGAGGVLVAPDGYHRRIREICSQHGILYIADEVVTAFGRLGEPFASSALYAYEPDILCLAKGINSGYVPLGAAVISRRIYDAIQAGAPNHGLITRGFTYTGHATACAAALANMDILEKEDLYGHVRHVGPLFQNLARERLMTLKGVGDVRGSHLMLGIELVADERTREPPPESLGLTAKIFDRALQGGLMVRPIGNILVLSPPLVVSEDDVMQMVAILEEAIAEVISRELPG